MWHAAGVLSDALVTKQSAATLQRVHAPKAHAAWLLQSGSCALPLRACTLFSSTATLVGIRLRLGSGLGLALTLTLTVTLTLTR